MSTRALRRPTRPLTLLLVLTALVAAGLSAVPVTAADNAGVVDGIEQAYAPGARVDGVVRPSTPVAHDGEALGVQAVEIGRPALEPTLGIDAEGTVMMTASFHDGLALVLPRTFVYRSTDGGLTWDDVTKRTPALEEPEPFVNADPFILTDQDTGRTFQPELTGACMYMNITDDSGDSWTSQPLSCGTVPVDHHSVEVGPFPPNLEPLRGDYPNILYHCSNRLIDVACGRSMDGGQTWSPGLEPAFLGYTEEFGLCTGGLHGHVDIDSAGRLFLPKGHCGTPTVAVSEDGALTWRRTAISDELGSASTHNAVAVDAADNVYYLWWDAEERLPWLSISTDHGVTWGEPMMVAPPGVAEVNFPVLEAGEEGRVAIAFPGTTVDDRTDTRRPWNHYMVLGTDLLGDSPTFLSTTANEAGDPVHRGNCGPGRCGSLWDFQDVQISPLDGGFWAAVADGCTNEACIAGDSGDNESTGQGLAVRQLTGPRVQGAAPAPDPAG
jgi:hypothetical protein